MGIVSDDVREESEYAEEAAAVASRRNGRQLPWLTLTQTNCSATPKQRHIHGRIGLATPAVSHCCQTRISTAMAARKLQGKS